jgi:hypothetical protein
MDVRDTFNMLPQIIMNILVIVQIVTWVIRTMMVVAPVLLRALRARLYKPGAPDPSPAWTTVVPTLPGPLYPRAAQTLRSHSRVPILNDPPAWNLHPKPEALNLKRLTQNPNPWTLTPKP